MRRFGLAASIFVLFSSSLFAQPSINAAGISQQQLDDCLRTSVITASAVMTVKELRDACYLLLEQKQQAIQPVQGIIEQEPVAAAEATEVSRPLLTNRLRMEELNRTNRFVLTPHRRNYILPFNHKSSAYTKPYVESDSHLQELDQTEVEFQFSIKILLREGIFNDNGHLYLGYTNRSLWQLYNRDLSAPFRETNHEPELILSFTNDWEIWGFRNVLNEAILNHQSNGQSGLLSRSWNRVMLHSVFEKGPFVLSFTPWYRLPEPAQRYPGDPRGDDNPDIEKYMGNFEFTGAFQRKKDIFSIMVRNNLRSNNKGALELGWSFPMSKRMPNVRGYVKYFSGYGQSLIDYNDSTDALGMGVVLTDLF